MDGFLNYLSDTEDEPTNHLLINLRQFSFLFFFQTKFVTQQKSQKGGEDSAVFGPDMTGYGT